MDAQGADRARPYVERAAATFTTLVDSEDLLGHLLGFKAIPNGFLIDESGVVRYRKVGGFDIRKQETAEIVRRWAAGSNLEEIAPEPFRSPQGTANSRSESLFRDGLALYRSGRRDEGMAMWRDALALDPDNYIIRKQIWAVENPDRFYAGDVDYGWQKEQMAEERVKSKG